MCVQRPRCGVPPPSCGRERSERKRAEGETQRERLAHEATSRDKRRLEEQLLQATLRIRQLTGQEDVRCQVCARWPMTHRILVLIGLCSPSAVSTAGQEAIRRGVGVPLFGTEV